MGQKGIKDIHHRKAFKENPRVGCLYKWEQESSGGAFSLERLGLVMIIFLGGVFEKERKRLGFGE